MHYLTLTELKALLKEMPTPRHKLLVLVQMWHGLRASEVLRLRGKDIQGGHITTKRLKGSKPCEQPFVVHEDEELDESKQLRELSKTLKLNERLFPFYTDKADRYCKNSSAGRFGYYRLMRRAGARAGLPPGKRKTHIMKHTCGTLAIADGAHYCQARLGLKSFSSIGPYVAVSVQKSSKAFAKTAMRLGEILED